MSLETLIACVGVIGATQALVFFVKSLEAKPAEGPSHWSGSDDSDFEESEEAAMERKAKTNFEIARAKAIMAMASEFAVQPKA